VASTFALGLLWPPARRHLSLSTWIMLRCDRAKTEQRLGELRAANLKLGRRKVRNQAEIEKNQVEISRLEGLLPTLSHKPTAPTTAPTPPAKTLRIRSPPARFTPAKRSKRSGDGAVDPYATLPPPRPVSEAEVTSLGATYVASPGRAPFGLRKQKATGARPERVSFEDHPAAGGSPWTVHRPLGHGAFGAVFDVSLEGDARRVALKICFREHRDFGVEREVGVLAAVAGRCASPPKTAVGRLAEPTTFFRYADASALAMRRADATLSVLAKAHGPARARFPEPVALFYAAGMLEALDQLHGADFLHADVKPDNVCLRFGAPDDCAFSGKKPKACAALAAAGYGVTLIDYSLAVDLRAFADGQRFESASGSPAQVEQYCWPPARKGASWRKEIDHYALGAILHELATGARAPRLAAGAAIDREAVASRSPRGWRRELWADAIAALIDGDGAVDLGALAKRCRAAVDADLASNPRKLLTLLEQQKRFLSQHGTRGGGAAAPAPAVLAPRVSPSPSSAAAAPVVVRVAAPPSFKREPPKKRKAPSPEPAPRPPPSADRPRRDRKLVSYKEPNSSKKLRNHGPSLKEM